MGSGLLPATACKDLTLSSSNLGRQEIRVAGAHGAKENDDGSIGLFMFSDGLVDPWKNRVLSPSEPSTEYHVKESDELNSFLFVAVTDGFGKSHIKWLVPRPRRWWLKWKIRSLLRNRKK